LPFVANGCIIFSANEKHHHERQTRHYHPRQKGTPPLGEACAGDSKQKESSKQESLSMTYEEAIEAEDVTREEARAEINRHLDLHCNWEIFLEQVGDKNEYTGKEILDWLGY
jgi:hypothetical protein